MPGSCDEVLEPAGHLPAVPLDQRGAEADEAGGLVAEEAGRADQRLELVAVGAA
jgi:hypothetical protein